MTTAPPPRQSRLLPAGPDRVLFKSMRGRWMIAGLLAAATLAWYWPALQFDTVNYDDQKVLVEGPAVQAGLAWASVKWALGSVVLENWQPVTNLSYLLVAKGFGPAPGAQHLANAALHAANAALLFLWLRRLTNATWRSAVAAAIFAWHPLRVESVAWIAERKDVLCAFFFLLTLLAYTKYVQSAERSAEHRLGSTSEIGSPSSLVRSPWSLCHLPSSILQPLSSPAYCLCLSCFALALMSKPMAVTLPGVLLLLDVWPLGRFTFHASCFTILRRLLVEKTPFFVLMVVFCLATYRIQMASGTVTAWDQLGLAPRVANAISAYAGYLGQLFWPANLAVLYPLPSGIDVPGAIVKAALLLAISVGCLTQFRDRPWLAIGWCWYLGMAFPVIGLIQVGQQAMADRYTYLPLIGPVVALVWTAADMLSSRRGGRIFLAVAAITIVSVLGLWSERQLEFWRNTIALFERELAVTPAIGTTEFVLGTGFERAGDTNRAIVCYRAAKRIAPRDFGNRRNLARLLVIKGQLAAAVEEYQSLLLDEPNEYLDHMSLAGVLDLQGREQECLFQLRESVRCSPDSVTALNNLAWALTTAKRPGLRDGPRAVTLAQHACELTRYQQPALIGTLAAALAEAGKFDEAVAAARQACALAAEQGDTNVLRRNQPLLELYRAHKTVTVD